MTKLNTESLPSETDDWRDLYLDQGEEMLSLARELLLKKDKPSVETGLSIVEQSLFEEDLENPDCPCSLKDLDFSSLVAPLAGHLSEKEFGPRAVYGLWVCARQGAKLDLDEKLLNAYLGKEFATVKVCGESTRKTAFRVLLHLFFQNNRQQDTLPMLKGNADFKSTLFDELTSHACAQYDLRAFLPLIMSNLQAKGDATVRQAVELLWSLVKAGADISEAIPFLTQNQARLAMFSDSNQVIAGYYLKTKQFENLQAWIDSPDARAAERAYRGLRMATVKGISPKEFVSYIGVNKLKAIANQTGLNWPPKL